MVNLLVLHDAAALIVMDKIQLLEASGNDIAAGDLGTIRYTYHGPDPGGGTDPSGSSFQGKVLDSDGHPKWIKFGEGSITHTQYWGERGIPGTSGPQEQMVTTRHPGPQIVATALEISPADCCGNYSMALGQDCSSGLYSLALGSGCDTTHPAGGPTQGGALAVGKDNTASGKYSVAMGWGNTAEGIASFADGSGNTVRGNYAVAMGYDCSAVGICSFADGSGCIARGDYSVAMGELNVAGSLFSVGSVAMGLSNVANGALGASVAMGDSNVASSYSAVAMGANNTASGYYSVAMGQGNKAKGFASFADGSGCIARGDYSVALGYKADTSNNYQFALGISNEDPASGMAAGGGNTFFIDNNQNVAMCVGGDLSFDISRCRSHLNVPVLDVSGDVRIRGICDPLGLGLINVSKEDAIDIFNSMDSSRNAQLLFSHKVDSGLWHCFTDNTGSDVSAVPIGGGTVHGSALWKPVSPTPQQGSALTPADTSDASGIKLKRTLIYGTDASGFMVGDGNVASGSYSVAMGSGNNAYGNYSVAMGQNHNVQSNNAMAIGGGTSPDDGNWIGWNGTVPRRQCFWIGGDGN